MPKGEKRQKEVAAPASRGEMQDTLNAAAAAVGSFAQELKKVAEREETAREMTDALAKKLASSIDHMDHAINAIRERGEMKARAKERALAVAARKHRALEDYARQHGIEL